MSVEHHASFKGAVHPWLGVGSCSLAAVCCTAIFYTSSFKNILPFVFLGIITVVTLMFGRSAGVLGTLSAALIFASVLFEPRPSLAMEDPIAQTHLMWMMVIGVVVAYWLGRDHTHNTSP
jgi:K+-sensing histidine kinase KdpD